MKNRSLYIFSTFWLKTVYYILNYNSLLSNLCWVTIQYSCTVSPYICKTASYSQDHEANIIFVTYLMRKKIINSPSTIVQNKKKQLTFVDSYPVLLLNGHLASHLNGHVPKVIISSQVAGQGTYTVVHQTSYGAVNSPGWWGISWRQRAGLV